MAINWNMKKAHSYVGSCAVCGESISDGFYYRNGSSYRHSACHADPEAHAPVAAVSSDDAAPVDRRPVARAHGHRAFGALLVDESFAAWEAEYEAEG